MRCCHTDRCVEGCLFEAPFYAAPSARPFSKGLLAWHVIPCFRFSSCAFTRIQVRQRSYGFASVDDTEQRLAQLAYWSLRRRVPLRALYPAPSPRASRLACHTVTFFYMLPLKKIPPELMLQRDLTNNSLSTVRSSPFRRFFWRYRAIPGGCFPERGR